MKTSENYLLRVSANLELDRKWAENFTQEELAEYVENRLRSSMGFRVARIKHLKVRWLSEQS